MLVLLYTIYKPLEYVRKVNIRNEITVLSSL